MFKKRCDQAVRLAHRPSQAGDLSHHERVAAWWTASSFSSSGLSVFVPMHVSAKNCCAPHAASASRWASRALLSRLCPWLTRGSIRHPYTIRGISVSFLVSFRMGQWARAVALHSALQNGHVAQLLCAVAFSIFSSTRIATPVRPTIPCSGDVFTRHHVKNPVEQLDVPLGRRRWPATERTTAEPLPLAF